MISSYSKYIEDSSKRILIIVDTQEDFSKYFNKVYLNSLFDYSRGFNSVIQLWDNHYLGKPTNDNYLYSSLLTNKVNSNLYLFPKQEYCIEKRYSYNVRLSHFKEIIEHDTYINKVNNVLRKGDLIKTINDTYLVYVGNNHRWFHIPKKLYNFIIDNIHSKFIIVGGAEKECLEDIFVTFKALNANISKNDDYIWSAKYCPIK